MPDMIDLTPPGYQGYGRLRSVETPHEDAPVNPRIAAVEAHDFPLCMFKVRDIQYTEDWVSVDDTDPKPMAGRVLMIVGWAFKDDGNYTHIAQLWDETSRCFGGGVIVPNDNIIECSRLGDME